MKKFIVVNLALLLVILFSASLSSARDPIAGKYPGPRSLQKIENNGDLFNAGSERDFWLIYWCPNPYMYLYRLPNISGDQYHSMRFNVGPGNDTLIAIGIYFYNSLFTGSPDVRLYVWGDLGGHPDSTALLYTAVIPYDSITQYPAATVHIVSGDVIVPGEFHIGLAVNSPGPNDTLAILSDDGYCGDSRATFSQDGGTWYFVKDYWGEDVNFSILAYMGGSYNGPVWYIDPNGDDNSGNGSRWNPYATFQHAINQAAVGDTIMALPGTYTGVGNKNIDFSSKNLTIMGQLGSDTTIIDVENPVSDFGFIVSAGIGPISSIQGLTITDANKGIFLQGGVGPILNDLKLHANAIGVQHDATAGGYQGQCYNSEFKYNAKGLYSEGTDNENTYLIDNCVFDSNTTAVEGDFLIKNSLIKNGVDGLVTDPVWPGYRFRADSCTISNMSGHAAEIGDKSLFNYCKIQNNTGFDCVYGTSIEDYIKPTFNNCEIDNNSGGIFLTGVDAYLSMNNTRYSNNGGPIVYSCSYRGDVNLDSCLFISNDTTALVISNLDAPVDISYSAFVNNGWDGLHLSYCGRPVTISRCTFANNQQTGILIGTIDDDFSLYMSIAYDNYVGLWLYGSFNYAEIIQCNDVYGNDSVNYLGTTDWTGIYGNFSKEPQFCNVSAYDYHLNTTSPCTPDSSGGCGQVGAYGIGCDELRPLIIYGYGSAPPKADCPVIHIRVIDPEGYYIGYEDDGLTFNQTLFPADYVTDYTGEECLDMVIVHYPIQGEYTVVVVDVPGGSNEPTYTIGVQLDGSTQYITDQGQLVGGESASHSFTVGEYTKGDANGDATVNILDITFLITYLYLSGPAPNPVWAGDADCNGNINILDITYLINYLYFGGPAPC